LNVREQLLALNDELRRLKSEGRRTVTIAEDSLQQLRQAVAAVTTVPSIAPAAARAPINHPRPATALPEPEPFRETPAVRAPAMRLVTPVYSSAPLPVEAPEVSLPPGDKPARWQALRELVLNHPVCRAHVRPGKQVVLGVGDLNARIFFVGEAPGAEEEVQGEPFVGPAGQLLTRMIQGMGLKREQVYIGNIMNWRPEMAPGGGGEQIGNRAPSPEEMKFCLPFLRAQLDIVQPQLIVALGKTAAEGLLGQGTFKTLGEIRGRWHAFSGVPLMVTYHPSYILRNQSNSSKRLIWEDLLKVMERAALPISDKQQKYFL
jgi:DNA polymerase